MAKNSRFLGIFVLRFYTALLLWFFVAEVSVFGQKADTIAVQKLDMSNIETRSPTLDRLDDYRNNRDYQYNQDTTPPQNPIAKFWYWLMGKLGKFFISKSFSSFWQYVILVVVAALASWLILKADFVKGLFVSPKNEDGLDYETITENIHELNFGELLENALSQHNYRLAVRYLYLQTLKKLADSELIGWQPTKTNRMYISELGNNSAYDGFINITRQFEYIWYGERPVIELEFMEIQKEVSNFWALIKN